MIQWRLLSAVDVGKNMVISWGEPLPPVEKCEEKLAVHIMERLDIPNNESVYKSV